MAQPTTRLRLGDTLVARGLLNSNELEVALGEQRRVYRPLGEILVSLGFVSPVQMAEVVAEVLGVKFEHAHDLHPDPMLTAALDSAFVRETGAFPIKVVEGTLHVVMVDPGNPELVSAVRQRFPFPLEVALVTEDDLNALTQNFLPQQEAQVTGVLTSATEQGRNSSNFPVEDLAAAIVVDGVRLSATDIHLEPEEKVTRLRYRIDGVLQAAENLPRDVTDAVISCVKILSKLDIAERRRPQDGRMRVQVDGRDVDLRISVMPVIHGENLVMRILDRTAGAIGIESLGFEKSVHRKLAQVAVRSHGLFLVTGPTGSGKTTTLYGLLGQVDAIERNVVTVEDPVEYRMPLVRQSQVEPAAGYGFGDGLRSLLRQDPDVMLVGEIRDEETAGMAIKASMTGHLVFSTLHTNDAVGAISRLVDLGMPAYLVEDALVGVLAQRLVRRICRFCVEPYEFTEEEARWMGPDQGTPMHGAGCDHCGSQGLSGRTVISELFL
ncbi:MAG: type II secretory ATPase GspE/PulE/Tfp pilus assembly ATPase PilB-like protein, partial [Planctomycetota bacterium]